MANADMDINESNGDSDCTTDNDTKNESSQKEGIQEKEKILKPGKKVKRGIVYLSTIPKYMNVSMIREIFAEYGKLGRVYLQLAENEADSVKHKRKWRNTACKHFTEGWVEFEKKRVAKFVAATLNNTQISSQKKSKFYDIMWNIKYLPKFKWFHLDERLAHERAVRKQRLLTEVAQAKRESNYFSYNVDRSKKLRRKQEQGGEETTFKLPEVRQRDTDGEIRSRKAESRVEDRTEFLKSIFG
ncbi:hypothetical protein DMN91_011230 [Ooceraea biroi]|uniref:Activator of basal transcription 1 n=1 Tax=Ooceraea biroi TaxID=2015173 RepID=A0A3L8DA22_OOCBI|nr:pre-rRNA-processing protein esf2-like [Ooceraea biroi]RLU17161.1 hypothetical protein DMN91_011230 [Ooceraea biroi]